MPALPSTCHSALLALAFIGLLAGTARACPFCTAESRTLTEEINDSVVVLFAKLTEPAAVAEALAGQGVPYGFVDPESGEARFAVERVLQGEDQMADPNEIGAIYFGNADFETTFFVRGLDSGIEDEPIDWTIPMPLSETAVAYVARLFELPESGGERLAFFLDYLEDEDPLLGQDAYDEFARAPYADLIAIADQMDRGQLLAWIEGGKVSPSRRRLFLTMLGVCGQPDDVKRLETMLLSDAVVLAPSAEVAVLASLLTDGPLGLSILPESIRFAERQRKLGLDAMIACYLTLSGKHGNPIEGLEMIDERFLSHSQAEYSHVYASLMALRFLMEEQKDLVPPERVIESARLLLNNGDFADQVIPDLARWKDWSVLDRLTTLYEASIAGEQNRYVREPIITYLDVASEQEGPIAAKATAALVRLEPLDPAAVKRARSLRAFGFLAQAKAKQDDAAAVAIESETEVQAEPIETAEPTPPTQTTAERVAEARARKAKLAAAASATTEAPAVMTKPTKPLPSQFLLFSAPLLGAVVCFGLFWMIFRSGTT